MPDNDRFVNGAEHITGHHLVADFGGGDKAPLFIVIDGRNLDTPLQRISADLADCLERPLDSVIDGGNQSGSQFD